MVPATAILDENIVEAMLNGIIPPDSRLEITVLDTAFLRGEALTILRHLVWIRYNLDIIYHFNLSEIPRVIYPYNYLGDTIPEALDNAIFLSELVTEDRIAIRHSVITSNLDGLMLDQARPDPNSTLRSLWPSTAVFQQQFPMMTKHRYSNVFRPSRNGFAHQYATPHATDTAYQH
jgi:hypothetical protein